MPSVYTDPRDFVALKRIPSPSHVGLKITARCSSPVYTCEKPNRKEVAKDNYERRKHQVTQCGYKSLNYKPYKSVGDVYLDDKELILKALGQIDVESHEQMQDDSSETTTTEIDRMSEDFAAEEENITTKEEKSENLQNLNGMLNKGRGVLNKVRLGISLFRVIEEERQKKVREREKKRIEDEEIAKKSMKPANENRDEEYDDDVADITRFLAPTPTRTLIVEESSDEEEVFPEFDDLEQKQSDLCVKSGLETTVRSSRSNSNSSDVSRKIVLARWQRIGSMASNFSIERFRRLRREKCNTEKEIDDDKNNHKDGEIHDKLLPDDNGNSHNQDESLNTELSEAEKERIRIVKENASTGRNKVSKSKKYKNDIPRPFSPVFTNINFYETGSREYTFRQLCAIHWILEAMSQDQQPCNMPPISTCWKLKDIKEDMRSVQKRVEREKVVDPIWRSFLTNPNKFSKGRTGRRGTLLQRRVSVAPSVLRMLSASSSGTTTTSPFANKSNLSTDGQHSDSPLLRERSETIRSRSSTHVVNFSPSLENEDATESLAATKMISIQRPINPLLANFKEKAYTVRDVVVAKNAFNRRGSKMIRSKSAPGISQRRKSTIKQQNTKNFNPENSDNYDEQQESIKKSSTQRDGISDKQRFVAAAIATYGAISMNKKVEKIPAHSRDKFEELSKENALILHDSLESRERTNVESMEKKFHSLAIMSDVNKAINVMRSKSALKVETEEEKKARFSEECSWYKSLLENLPYCIREDRNNGLILDKIAKFGSLEGRKISSAQFLRVLSLLRSWELCYPDISAAIEFVRDKVVKMDKREFEDWFQSRVNKHRT